MTQKMKTYEHNHVLDKRYTLSLISSFSYTLQNVRYLTFCKVILKSIK